MINLEACGGGRAWFILCYYSSICVVRFGEITKEILLYAILSLYNPDNISETYYVRFY
jgi:hypothetical protein